MVAPPRAERKLSGKSSKKSAKLENSFIFSRFEPANSIVRLAASTQQTLYDYADVSVYIGVFHCNIRTFLSFQPSSALATVAS
jgi:hypothetical protein